MRHLDALTSTEVALWHQICVILRESGSEGVTVSMALLVRGARLVLRCSSSAQRGLHCSAARLADDNAFKYFTSEAPSSLAGNFFFFLGGGAQSGLLGVIACTTVSEVCSFILTKPSVIFMDSVNRSP